MCKVLQFHLLHKECLAELHCGKTNELTVQPCASVLMLEGWGLQAEVEAAFGGSHDYGGVANDIVTAAAVIVIVIGHIATSC
jgi:hypothetical protein